MLERYTTSHFETLQSWLAARGAPAAVEAELPSYGYVWPGVAAAFIRKCEGGVGIMDSLVTNPKACPVMRHQALDALYKQLITDSAALGIVRLLGFTLAEDTHKRSLRHGFKEAAYVVLVRVNT